MVYLRRAFPLKKRCVVGQFRASLSSAPRAVLRQTVSGCGNLESQNGGSVSGVALFHTWQL